jgi:hypothetical protein
MNHRLATLIGIPFAACIAIAGCGASTHVEDTAPLPTGEEVAAKVSADAQRSYERDPKAVLYASSRQPDPSQTQEAADAKSAGSERPEEEPTPKTNFSLSISEGDGTTAVRLTEPVHPDHPNGLDLSKSADFENWIGGLEAGQRVALYLSPQTTYGQAVRIIDRLTENGVEWIMQVEPKAGESRPKEANSGTETASGQENE